MSDPILDPPALTDENVGNIEDPVQPAIPQWQIDIGLPQPEEPFIQKYLDGRDALIEQEATTHASRQFIASLTPMAREACSIVDRIRATEQHTMWAGTSEDGPIHPGMPFHLARDRMLKTEMWKIVRKMPKGALLHCHFDAMIDIAWLVDQALSTEGMGFFASEPLTSPEALQKATVSFLYVGGKAENGTSIYDPTYTPSTPLPVTQVVSDYPHTAIYPNFQAWLTSRMIITRAESLNPHHGLNAVWSKFTSTFPIIGPILFYEPIFRAALRRLFRQLLNDGVRWAEFRYGFVLKFRRKGQTVPDDDFQAFFEAFEDELISFQESPEGKGFWGARWIWTPIRVFDSKVIIESMQHCIEIKKQFPHLICGLDFVGQEDVGRPLTDLLPEIFWFKKRCAEEGLNIPFFLHAGETLSDPSSISVSTSNTLTEPPEPFPSWVPKSSFKSPTMTSNIPDALLLSARRIGHGFSLLGHPLLINLVKERNILIESCPLSHEILRLTGNIKQHPLPIFLAQGIKCAVSCDDPAILWCDGESEGFQAGMNCLSPDFWQCLQGMQGLGLEGLGAMAENSLRWAAWGMDENAKEDEEVGEDDQDQKTWNKDVKDGIYGTGLRAKRMREWREEWGRFCEWVVLEYAGWGES